MDDITQQARRMMGQRLNTAAASVEIEIDDGEIWLSGQLDSYYQKQLAQEAVRNLPQVRSIHNDIHVRCSLSHS